MSDIYELIDALVERGLHPTRYTPREAFDRHCLATVLSADNLLALDDFPVTAWAQSGTARIAYWPEHVWTQDVDEYLDIIFDSSGEESEGGFTD